MIRKRMVSRIRSFTPMHLAGPADAFAAAALEDGFSGQIPCYDVCLIGLKEGPFRSESGMAFYPAHTLETAPDLDTIVIPGGSGLRDPKISLAVSEWILSRTNQTRRLARFCTGIMDSPLLACLMGARVTTTGASPEMCPPIPKLRVNHRGFS